VQQDLYGHRGRKNDPLYRARRTLHTGDDLLNDKCRQRLTALFGVEEYVQIEAPWGVYERMTTGYREPRRARGRQLITSLSNVVRAAFTELITFGCTLKTRADDVLAYFHRPGTSNGTAEAINGRIEHIRGCALGFQDLTRSLLETGGFGPDCTLNDGERTKRICRKLT